MEKKEKLIVALDVDTKDKAMALVSSLKGLGVAFKVGSELFTSCGPEIVKDIAGAGGRVFLDLKFHDIPNTAAKSAIAAMRLGVFMFNVHALGGYDMMRAVMEAVDYEAGRLKTTRPKVIAVTVLTSTGEDALKKIGINENIRLEVLRLARLSKDARLDGVVASPEEAALIRDGLGKDFLIVTPGIRPAWAAINDQKRIATPSEAIRSGANYIVVGRPVTESKDPAGAVKKILEEV